MKDCDKSKIYPGATSGAGEFRIAFSGIKQDHASLVPKNAGGIERVALPGIGQTR